MVVRNNHRPSSAPVEVEMPDGSIRLVTRLLTLPEKRKDGHVNWKLSHTNDVEKKYFVVGLSLAPANSSGFEVCSSRSKGCTKACLARSGFGYFFPNITDARIAKTRLFFTDREVFMSKLVRELEFARRKAVSQGKRLACRLNVFSDLFWERLHPELFTTFKNVQFYDYTKHHRRMLRWCARRLPKNYFLTFSRSECNEAKALSVLEAGGNVSVVFEGELPARWNGYRVVNGDATDLRFKDGDNVVVGLRAKGVFGRQDTSGFVVRHSLTVLNN